MTNKPVKDDFLISRVPKDDKEYIKALAKENNVPISKIVRRMIEILRLHEDQI